ncbi:MAG: hypothetical protein KKH94_11365 [Candidatus Omnitrophica bacterium]|nr:hypothetical protein [Candidatus Omnitrophota bacterium]
MKVKCILSHEKPLGRKFEKGKEYERDIYNPRFFTPVEIKINISADPAMSDPEIMSGKRGKRKIKKIIKRGRIGTREKE